MKSFYVIVVFCIMLTGCETTQSFQSQDKRPEVYIESVSKKEVKDSLVAEMLRIGMQLKKNDEYTLIFSKPDKSFTSALFFGSQYDTTPEMRINYYFIETESGVRVYGSCFMVTNPNSAHERIRDLTSQNAKDMQGLLEKLKLTVKKTPEDFIK